MPRNADKKPHMQFIRTRMIRPSASTRAEVLDESRMVRLTDSIRQNGMIQPILVTREPLELWYTVVAGRRRMEAARRLGLEEIPAIVIPPDQALCAALFENLCREEPSCFETARLLAEMKDGYPGTETGQFAKALGLPEQEIADKFRLLSFGPDRIELCQAAGITQQMAQRILALPKSEQDRLFFGLLNPSHELEERAWKLRDRLGLDAAETPRRTMAVKDVRIFFNTIENAVEVMKQAGIEAATERHDYDGLVEYLIRIPSATADQRPHDSVV